MISKNATDKQYFLYLAEMFHLDIEDKLEMEDHAFQKGTLCITHKETKRAVQVRRDQTAVFLNYIDGNGRVENCVVEHDVVTARRTISFLNLEAKQI